MAWKLHAIEQMQLRGRRRANGVGRPKFDFHTGFPAISNIPVFGLFQIVAFAGFAEIGAMPAAQYTGGPQNLPGGPRPASFFDLARARRWR